MRVNSLLKICVIVPSVLSACNPLKSSDCAADPALGTSFKEDFKSESPYFDVVSSNGVSFGDDGLELKLAKRLDNPTLQSKFYIMFGKVEVTLQAAEGQGLISSFFLQSDDLDEIDIELFGGDGYEFQLNFFSKGDTTTYDRGEYHATSSNPLQNFHTYTLDWTKDSLTWLLDGEAVRTLDANNPQGYPQTPMFIRMGLWAGGDPSNEQGTIEWAGGLTDYSDLPFSMYVKSLIVTDYSTGEKYEYTDNSGDWTSIKAVDGEINGRQEQAEEEFKTLQNGGSVYTDFEASSSSSSAASSSSSSSSSKLTSSLSSSSEKSSSSSSSSSSFSSSSLSKTPSSSDAPSSSSAASSSSSTASSSSSDAPSSSFKASSKASSKASASTLLSSTSEEKTTSAASSTTADTSPTNNLGSGESNTDSTNTETVTSASSVPQASTAENMGSLLTTSSFSSIFASIICYILI